MFIKFGKNFISHKCNKLNINELPPPEDTPEEEEIHNLFPLLPCKYN